MGFEKLISVITREVSGERTKRLTNILSQYHRIQASKEFLTASKFIYDKLKNIGDNKCQIHEYVADGTKRYYDWYSPLSWDIEDGELIQLEPERLILCQFSETPESICTHSKDTDIEGEVIHIGSAKPEEVKDRDIEGKIVLTTGRPRAMIEQLEELGAIGVIAYPSEERAQGYSEMIQYVGLWPNADNIEKSTFGFSLSRRQASKLISQIKQKKKIIVKAKIKASLYAGNMHVLSTKIEGTKRPREEIILIAHICHPAPSANDNASGSALLFEIYRSLKTMIDKGVIEKPHRTIRFLWVPEFSGTLPWIIEKKKEEGFTPIFCINLDMVGEHPVHVGYPFTFNQSSISTPSYLNDIVAEVIEHVKDNPAAIERGGWQFPWNHRIVPYSGGSDHILFNDEPFRIPSVMFGHPDTFHHTNLDTIEKVDQTTLKRVGITTLATTIIGSSLDKYSDSLAKAYVIGYQKRKAKLINMISTEIEKSEDFQENEKLNYKYIIVKIINKFIENEKKSIDLMQKQFQFLDRKIINYLNNDLKLLVSGIQENFSLAFDQDMGTELDVNFQRIPKRKWVGPINSSKLYEITNSSFKLEESSKISDKQLTKLREFFTKSSGVYGGFILEITNLIDNTNTKLDILTLLSLVNWKVLEFQILEDFLRLLEYLGYITF